MLWTRISVNEGERTVVTRDGRFAGILTPGEYRVLAPRGVRLEVENHRVRDLVFQSAWAEYVANKCPRIAERHFTRVETAETQIALVYVNGELFDVVVPAKCLLFWRAAANVTAEFVNVIDGPRAAMRRPPLEPANRCASENLLLVRVPES